MSASGELLWTSTDPMRSIGTLVRSDLTVLSRLGPLVVKTSYTYPASAKEKVVAFKFNLGGSGKRGGYWDEIQIRCRLPTHPYILPIESLVVGELSGLGVVGYTMPIVAAPTLDKHVPRPFRLR
ncbi:hypothetical protein MFIFM68171_02113 [Madurella fahalii]|uniref:Uncharacterized protein n=1 Tax=Madurella fahalii TaxID=1157608 RepID=A0ABQ0G2A9_9PEZI